jgi:SAM-dependent methyltransferase
VPEHWLDSRLVSDLLIWPRLGGHHWYGFLKEHYFPQPVERVLSVGCGSGHLERGLQSHGICVATEAFDVSPAAVVVAQEKAAEAGCGDVRYWVADGNSIRLPRSRYDAVFASMSLHHVTKLERLLKQIHGALKPGGIFVVNEYVGPSRFQWTDAQLRIMNEALPLLPDRLRLQSNTGAIKTGVCRPSVEDVIREDPSEAVRSADIPRLLRRYFRIETRVDYGGTLLYPLLEYIVGNFDASREDDVAILRLLSHLEDELIRDGILQSDFAFFVARRR